MNTVMKYSEQLYSEINFLDFKLHKYTYNLEKLLSKKNVNDVKKIFNIYEKIKNIKIKLNKKSVILELFITLHRVN